MISGSEIARLEALYAGRRAYHGELHDHSDSGGTSDGKTPLAAWPEQLRRLKMDFAAILDHRQVRHMYRPEWKDGLFIAGTEPGTRITDSEAKVSDMHYNILLPHRDDLSKLLEEFPEYQFSGGIEGHFVYPTFTRERFGELIDAISRMGGFMVHPHPKQLMDSENPLDYWFRDGTGLEVFYNTMDSSHTAANYPLWTELLKLGKRVYATAGCDYHKDAHATALTTIYSDEKSSAAFVSRLRDGDFTCGPVGIRMAIGETRMGGECAFDGQTLLISVQDFHESVQAEDHAYRLDLITDEGLQASFPVSCKEAFFAAVPAGSFAFWCAEVIDETADLRIAIGNPIWNTKA